MTKTNSKRLRDPLVGINRRTAKGREIRDLYRSRMAAIEREPDATLQAAVRRAVELQLLTEQFRAGMLAGGKFDAEQMVRVENMLSRAERHVAELIAKMPKPPEWWEHQDEEDDDGNQG
jgi:hypothetical protein